MRAGAGKVHVPGLLIGLGIGCFGLLFLSGIAFLVFGAWMKSKGLIPDTEYEVPTKDEGLGDEPETSAWDGSVKEVKDYLRPRMKDEDSLKILETWAPKKINVAGVEYWGVRCRWKAKNSFGAYDTRDDVFFIRGGRVVDVHSTHK